MGAACNDMKTTADEAVTGVAQLSSAGRYTVFTFGDQRLKFIAPYSLERYVSVSEWDRGYLVVMAKYAHDDNPIEEYIDINSVLSDLGMDQDKFLDPIDRVEVLYA